ncbi:hypothetical protein SETIT_4G132700v2 [Setaria italica]|uniref:Uncharacterized protein n=1 Tax=Setaria italica TaxID=4555 RepID=A0A368QTR4_SETIT|nr:hypothetical protein SETIT_4G132700v2 [Setaria italica]
MSEEPAPKDPASSSPHPGRRRTQEPQQHRSPTLRRRRGRRRPRGPDGFDAGKEIALGSPFWYCRRGRQRRD